MDYVSAGVVGVLSLVFVLRWLCFSVRENKVSCICEQQKYFFMVLTFMPLAFLPYHDADMVKAVNGILEMAYLIAYWGLSTAWVVFGVAYLVL